MFANEIRPYQCHADHRRQTRDAVDVAQVGVFKHKDIDVDLTEFPVSAIEAQNQSCLYWQKCKYHLRDKVKVESISGKKSLYAPQIGITFNTRRHRRRYLVEADRLHDTKGVKDKRKQFYASKIHYQTKMLLHNRDDFINFVAVSGSCRNFHGKSGQTFL